MTDFKKGDEVLLKTELTNAVFKEGEVTEVKLLVPCVGDVWFSVDKVLMPPDKDAEIARLKGEVERLKRELLHSYSLNSVKPEPYPFNYNAAITKSNVPHAIRDLHTRLAKLEESHD